MNLPRRFARATLYWLFGLTVSILLGSLWGSAVAGSRETTAEVVHDVASEQVVEDRVAGWIAEGLDSVDLTVPGETTSVDLLMAMPETGQILDNLADQVVDAMFAPAGATAVIDPATALLPAVPQIATVLARAGLDTDQATVMDLVSRIEPVPLDASGEIPITSAATRVSAALTLAAVGAGLAALLFGGGAVAISPDRVAAVRHLAYRLMLTSLSLAVMLRLGSWIADPAGGATPWRAGLSTILGSFTYIPLLAAAAGCGVMIVVRQRRKSAPEAIQDPEGHRA
jgi:hypothetical protein